MEKREVGYRKCSTTGLEAKVGGRDRFLVNDKDQGGDETSRKEKKSHDVRIRRRATCSLHTGVPGSTMAVESRLRVKIELI